MSCLLSCCHAYLVVDPEVDPHNCTSEQVLGKRHSQVIHIKPTFRLLVHGCVMGVSLLKQGEHEYNSVKSHARL